MYSITFKSNFANTGGGHDFQATDLQWSRRTPMPNNSWLGRDDERWLSCRRNTNREPKNKQNKTRWMGAAYCCGLVFSLLLHVPVCLDIKDCSFEFIHFFVFLPAVYTVAYILYKYSIYRAWEKQNTCNGVKYLKYRIWVTVFCLNKILNRW